MWGVFKGLFGGSANAEKIVNTAADGIYNGLDKLVYTDEEKTDAYQKGVDTFLAFVKVAYDDNSFRSVTRRWLAWAIVGFNLLLAGTASAFAIMGKIDIVNSILAIATSLQLGWAFVAVVVFYFGVQFFRVGK